MASSQVEILSATPRDKMARYLNYQPFPLQLIADFVSVGATLATAVEIRNVVSPQQDDLRLSRAPPGQNAGSGARARDRNAPADLRADSLTTVLPTPHEQQNTFACQVY
ncbi:hypothetical protein PoB_000146200 [Plakobranchus ocellatus]|uniref:Uncharacterized protein n=1 Tax=Plakobranchus ocellatus TaxID=259542 RepID=A0AAV3XWW6_9GAST|nr:hypothetical protein PoB_000146200 [Plakobranchus ocellatus]